MSRTWKIIAFAVILVVVAGWAAWSGPWRMAPTRSGAAGIESASSAATPAAGSSSLPRTASAKVPRNTTSAVNPTTTPVKPLSARQVFADAAMSLGDRFDALIGRAVGGDQSAEHFALQLANECQSVTSVPADQPPVGHKQTTPYQVQLRSQSQTDCAGVLDSPGFDQFKEMLKKYPTDVFDQSLKHSIRKQFADKGADAALQATVGAIMARPDETTAMMAADQLKDLDISSLYMEPEFESVASVNPNQRNLLMRYALGLLACDYGRPCGPNSFAVRSTCFALGACVPGADLQTVYERELLSGQQVRDVQALLAYFRRLRPAPVPGG